MSADKFRLTCRQAVRHILLASLAAPVLVNAQSATGPSKATKDDLEEIVVTGYRKSLTESTTAKREAVGFTDSIFAEDIGKFPDTNIAESFNRIPGVTISREITGEGINVAIRGLGTNFTRVLLNNAPVAIASTSQDNASQNREVDLDLFPTELFSQLTVTKSPTSELIEGGAAGTVNMRMARPFDYHGSHLTYQLQGIDNEGANGIGTRGSVVGSWTNDTFGVLIGVAGVRNKVATTGFETVGWTSLNLTQAQCGGGTLPCNTTGGTGAGPGTINTVPNNPSTVGAGLTPGATIDNAFLLANNPGLSIQQIDNALIPRLGRPMFDEGTKDRTSAVVSLEFRPNDDMHFFLDSMYGKKENSLERVDMMWGVRRTSQGGLIIPKNMQVDRSNCSVGCVVTSATFANSQALLEYRPYKEDLKFWGTNPGMTWQINDTLNLDVQGNYTHSDFHREDPTVLLVSQPTTVTYTNNGGIPVISSSLDLNNPSTFAWSVSNRGGGIETGRTDMVDEKRETTTKGARTSLTWGDDKLNLKFGGAYDEVSRDIRPMANSQQWQNAACGGNPSVYVAGNRQPPCRGDLANQITPSNLVGDPYPSYPGLGTGYSVGMPTPLTYRGSLVPNASAQNYLQPTSYGFVKVDWPAFAAASNYDAIHALISDTASTPTTANWATITEKTTGLFTEVNGDAMVGTNRLRYNIGVRYVETDQIVTSRLTGTDPRNPVTPATGQPDPADGSRYPDVVTLQTLDTNYSNVLPSASLAWSVTPSAIVRVGLSRTMTRANPAALKAGITVPNADASSASLGNPTLTPYISDNMDFGFEYYTGDEGYFGVAAFRKNINGFTQPRQTNVPFGSLAQYGLVFASLGAGQQSSLLGRAVVPGDPNTAIIRLDETINAPGALHINGLEFNWVQPLDVLLGRFGMDGFGFSANYTFIDQTGTGAAPALAAGVPPQTYNATFYYEKHGVSARVSINSAMGSQLTGPNSNQQGVTGAELFGVDYTQVDFSSSFDLPTMFGWSKFVPQLTFDVTNITAQTRRSYSQFTNAAYTVFDSGRTVTFGVRGKF